MLFLKALTFGFGFTLGVVLAFIAGGIIAALIGGK